MSSPSSPAARASPLPPASPVAGLSVGGSSNMAAKALDGDIKLTTPHELIGWVDQVVDSLDQKFTAMQDEVLERLATLSTRIDTLEGSLLELTQGAAALPSEGDASFPPSEQGD